MKTFFIKIGIILLGISFFTSCEERIDIELKDSDRRIVVEGEITSATKAHSVKLTTSSSYFYNQNAPVVSGALVSISDDAGNTFLLTETPVGSGIYFTDPTVFGVSGRTYTLKIENVDIDNNGKFETYTASEKMRYLYPLDSLSFKVYDPDENPPLYEIKGWGFDPPTLGDYYLWKYYKNGVLETDTLDEFAFADDQLVNGNYLPGITMFVGPANPGDTIMVEARSTSKEYYEFVVSFMIETRWNQGGFGGPPANIKTNISNGGLGWFGAADISYIKSVIPN